VGISNDERAIELSDPYRDMSFGERPVGFGDRPAIAVVDLQRAYIEAEFEMGGSELVEHAVENTAQLLAVAREKGIPVATCAMAYQSAEDMPHWKISAMYNGDFFHGSPGVEIDPRVYDADYDFKVTKSGPSIFFSTPVHAFFTKHRVDTVIICGCNTSGCIRASVIDSFAHGWRTIVPRECVGDVDRGPQDANLLDIERRYADVLSVNDVIAYLQG
jgi:maleamate amidohydrolase